MRPWGRSIDGSEAAPARFAAASNKECGNAKTEILGVIWASDPQRRQSFVKSFYVFYVLYIYLLGSQ